MKEKIERFYNRTYKLYLLIPIFILIASIAYLSVFYIQTGDIIRKDVSLTGGTTITIFDRTADIGAI